MSKNTKTTDDKYICPEKAVRKLRSGRRFRTPLYLYGVTGVGKTSLIIHNLNTTVRQRRKPVRSRSGSRAWSIRSLLTTCRV